MRITGKIFPSIKDTGTPTPYTLPYGLMSILDPSDQLEVESDGLYACHVQAPGMKEFTEFAASVGRERIVAGGPQANLFPEMLTPYAKKVIRGPCNDIRASLLLPGDIVTGVVSDREPAYSLIHPYMDLLRATGNYLDLVYLTSYSCRHSCSFCSIGKVNSGFKDKTLADIERELNSIRLHIERPSMIFIGDPNFLMLEDWYEREECVLMSMMYSDIGFQTSADMVVKNKDKLSHSNVSLVQMGLEDVTESFAKNSSMDAACDVLHSYGIDIMLNVMINPLLFNDEVYDKTVSRIVSLKPKKAHYFFRMPTRYNIEESFRYSFDNPGLYSMSSSRYNELMQYKKSLEGIVGCSRS